jgi:ABC-type branched-subunit amino acid transport system substrate-binding protein
MGIRSRSPGERKAVVKTLHVQSSILGGIGMKRVIGATTALALMLPSAALAQDTVKVGILVALEGAFAAGGADGVRNVELALKLAGGKAGGKKIETVVAATDTTPATTTEWRAN